MYGGCGVKQWMWANMLGCGVAHALMSYVIVKLAGTADTLEMLQFYWGTEGMFLC